MYTPNEFLKIVCSNSSGEQLILDYRLFDNSLVNRWKNLVLQSISEKKELSVNYNRRFSDQEVMQLFEKFVADIEFINLRYDRQLTVPTSIHQLIDNNTLLNDLHAEYEFYGDRCKELESLPQYTNPSQWPLWKRDSELHEKMLRLNDQIHRLELIAKTKREFIDKTCYALIDWLPAGLHENLLPEDYLLFNSETFWGYAYLGYNTLGKNWISICQDNDLDVVKRKAVRPQKRFAAEFILEFKQKGIMYATQNMFHNWIIKNNLLEYIKDDLSYPSLAFGSVPLGKLAFYRYHKFTRVTNQDLWSSEWQSNFNLNVWSKFDSVQQVLIHDKPGKIMDTHNDK